MNLFLVKLVESRVDGVKELVFFDHGVRPFLEVGTSKHHLLGLLRGRVLVCLLVALPLVHFLLCEKREIEQGLWLRP